ncbi:hypothetical protein TNCV_3891861 [Trichonephila clavipes]|nr:hypothetical protein TNCV_3891861 [Trichonephila clavipes]
MFFTTPLVTPCLSQSKIYEWIEHSKQGRTLCDDERSDSPSTPTTENNVQVLEGALAEEMIYNEAALLKGYTPNDYVGGRETRCIEVLPTIPHSPLDNSTVASGVTYTTANPTSWGARSLTASKYLLFVKSNWGPKT